MHTPDRFSVDRAAEPGDSPDANSHPYAYAPFPADSPAADELTTFLHESGWEVYGAELIPADEVTFADYARDLAEDLGLLEGSARWPSNHIDWFAAARDLAQDYTLVTIDGEDYYAQEH